MTEINTLYVSVAKDVNSNNFSKALRYMQTYLLNSFAVFLLYYSLKILPAKSSGCFIFICISTSHAHFPNDKIHIPWMPMRCFQL